MVWSNNELDERIVGSPIPRIEKPFLPGPRETLGRKR
jgi:hypothetical protein